MECNYFDGICLAFSGRTMEQEISNGWAKGVHPEDFNRCQKFIWRIAPEKGNF